MTCSFRATTATALISIQLCIAQGSAGLARAADAPLTMSGSTTLHSVMQACEQLATEPMTRVAPECGAIGIALLGLLRASGIELIESEPSNQRLMGQISVNDALPSATREIDAAKIVAINDRD